MADFRFFDSRQKYLLFVTTTNEKTIIAEKIDLLLKPLSQKNQLLKFLMLV